ncbi:pyridine nucleotide-disulfide oxidoreductase [Paraburkholderia caffeinilytica]|uniref:Pyridine nucleotide-disulfide oxidoreductase n=1 Tax=Paraburkholderia caffeinilytica TaxID=1761016 RepID=A0ABQ1MFW6_9BURK|nr:FAD-binding protein [Paraburkholderia caffeinilytica]AXL49876.1 pyridine nucleotide-disulfide oxidoreductase [Paraburkholderia caffeinilytica]GGC38415.1 pyridine nucleotide-disulfide oxidoreductase [Paraburkholderia caffeinilytica]CAB3786102.1 Ferredoxin--NADP reductase [Paraburkholderia caffeinilytica]
MSESIVSVSALDDATAGQRHDVDVLVVGGGPAGTWAAIGAAARGAKVVLADKGFCGTSGATAPSGTAIWYVSPQGDTRERAKSSRFGLGGQLAEHDWMDRVLEQTWVNVHQLAQWGYPFPVDENGEEQRTSLQGPDYMRLMRKRVKESGACILDHSPALELLVDGGGAVAGARGVQRQSGETWVVRAKAVVIATGGCAFQSRALGCNVLTGDGQLMAAEVGAELSGMEFSNAYGLGPAFASVTKSLFYKWATFYDEQGVKIEGAGSAFGRSVIARELQTRRVFACLDRADEQVRAWMRTAQPNFFLPFDRLGLDPFTQHFPVTLRLEGTVRGTGGLHVTGRDCSTSVEGLYAAGDAATREMICGGFTGGGSHNAAWAMSSGFWAGAGAADHAQAKRRSGIGRLYCAGAVGLSGTSHTMPFDSVSAVKTVQGEVFPYERNWTRSEDLLVDSLGRLDALWARLRNSAPARNAQEAVRAREAAAMVATARWMYRSAQARTETRGMHRRAEYRSIDAGQRHRLISGGLDDVWVRRKAVDDGAIPVERQEACA